MIYNTKLPFQEILNNLYLCWFEKKVKKKEKKKGLNILNSHWKTLVNIPGHIFTI